MHYYCATPTIFSSPHYAKALMENVVGRLLLAKEVHAIDAEHVDCGINRHHQVGQGNDMPMQVVMAPATGFDLRIGAPFPVAEKDRPLVIDYTPAARMRDCVAHNRIVAIKQI